MFKHVVAGLAVVGLLAAGFVVYAAVGLASQAWVFDTELSVWEAGGLVLTAVWVGAMGMLSLLVLGGALLKVYRNVVGTLSMNEREKRLRKSQTINQMPYPNSDPYLPSDHVYRVPASRKRDIERKTKQRMGRGGKGV